MIFSEHAIKEGECSSKGIQIGSTSSLWSQEVGKWYCDCWELNHCVWSHWSCVFTKWSGDCMIDVVEVKIIRSVRNVGRSLRWCCDTCLPISVHCASNSHTCNCGSWQDPFFNTQVCTGGLVCRSGSWSGFLCSICPPVVLSVGLSVIVSRCRLEVLNVVCAWLSNISFNSDPFNVAWNWDVVTRVSFNSGHPNAAIETIIIRSLATVWIRDVKVHFELIGSSERWTGSSSWNIGAEVGSTYRCQQVSLILMV